MPQNTSFWILYGLGLPRIFLMCWYHTITDVCTTELLKTKPSSDDDSGFGHGFVGEASLPLALSAPAVSHDTTRLCQIVVTLWDCHIHADAVRALSWIFFMYFLLSDGGSPRLVKKTEVELAIKPLHLTPIGNTFVIQPFSTLCFCRSFYFSKLRCLSIPYMIISRTLNIDVTVLVLRSHILLISTSSSLYLPKNILWLIYYYLRINFYLLRTFLPSSW